MTPSNHPPTCRACEGTGWQPAPGVASSANGQPVHYTTVTPCTHHWADDEPGNPTLCTYGEYRDGLIRRGDLEQLAMLDRVKGAIR